MKPTSFVFILSFFDIFQCVCVCISSHFLDVLVKLLPKLCITESNGSHYNVNVYEL